MKTPLRRSAVILSCFAFGVAAQGETLDSLHEYGDAATTPRPNAAGNSQGADFSNSATNEYAITSGGEDFWNTSDHGTFISDSMTSRAAGENFSAVVRSVSIAADPLEELATEWGRTGVMARKNPNNPASANVAHIRKTGGGGGTLLQGRPSDGAGTDRNQPVADGGYFNNVAANTLNGSVRDTPIWLGLHRYDGTWYATWADDAGGVPGTWSDTRIRSATPDLSGEVWLGLAHQSHRNLPHTSGGNTALFDNFNVGPFDNTLGDFPDAPFCDIAFNGNQVLLTAGEGPLGGGGAISDVDWRVDFIGEDTLTPGGIKVDIWTGQNNAGNRAAFDTLTQGTPPSGTTVIETIRWASNNYVETNAAGVNLFAEAVPGSFGGNEEQYATSITGEIFIPSDASRDNLEAVKFHDGVDDYCLLVVDNVTLIDQNGWSNLAGTGNGGGTQATFDCSDSKFDNGAWVPFQMGTWEGGGGDDAILVWDALDRTGEDFDTGAVDSVTGSYGGTALADGAQVSFAHDRSDEIPSANFRTVQPGTAAQEDGFGQPVAEVLGTEITTSTRELRVYINGALIKTVPTLPSLVSAEFTGRDRVTIVLTDVVGAREVDTGSLSVERNGTVIGGPVSKAGALTTITDLSIVTEPWTDYTYVISGTTTADPDSVPFEFTATVRSHAIRETLRAGLPAPPNATEGWDYMEFDAVAALGGNLGGNPQNYRDAQDVIRDADAPLAQEQQPFVNHTDPDTNANSGDWIPDLPILSDDPGGDDQYVTLARTTLTIAEGEEGDRTFRIRGDDGYGFRITGATFISTAGNANNMIDPLDPSSAFFPAGTGDSNAFLVCNFPASGDYLVEFFAFEGGGGSYQEIAWAPGAHNSLGDSSAWELVGNTEGYVATTVWGDIPASVIPPLPTDEGGWGVHLWYNAQVGSLVNTMNYLRGIDAGTATFDSEFVGFQPFLDHKDDANGGVHQFPNDLPFPGDPLNPGDTQNIAMLAHARLVAPVDGDYTIQIRSDDGFLFRFLDPTVQFAGLNTGTNGHLHPSALNEFFHPNGTGDTNTRAWVNLAKGEYDVYFVWWEGGGGSSFEISSAPGIVPAHAAPPYELLTAAPSASNLYLGTDAPPAINMTEVVYDQGADMFTLSWTAFEGSIYGLFWSPDGIDWGADINDSITAIDPSGDPIINFDGDTLTFGPFTNPSPGAPVLLFRAEQQ